MDPTCIRPYGDWLLVLDDKRQTETSGGIILPTVETGVEKVTEGSGEVISVGRGGKIKATGGLEKGLKVVYRGFIKYAQRLETDEKWPDGQAKIYFFIKIEDILAIAAPGVSVGVFSGRPQVPAKKGE